MQKYYLLSEHLAFDVKTFIIKHLNDNYNALAFKLKANKQTNFSTNLVLETLINYKKALHKIPTMAANYCWLPAKSYEQASSELTAFYKSSLFNGQNLLDLCGGLGVDDMAFATNFKQVLSLDADNELNEIVKCNIEKLKIKNITRITTFAEIFLEDNSQHFDLVYIDADRRPEANAKTFKLNECTPNIIEIWPLLKKTTNQVLIKLSPLVDINYCKTALSNIAKIEVVAVKNEVKEVLLYIDFNRELVANLVAVNLIDKNTKQSYNIDNQLVANTDKCSLNAAIYFFEPNAAIIKAGLSLNYAQSLGLTMLAPNSNFYIGNNCPNQFMGRGFEIIKAMIFSKSNITNYLKMNGITKANISKRNFPINESEIAKQFKIKDGGDDFLFFTQNNTNEKLFFHCKK